MIANLKHNSTVDKIIQFYGFYKIITNIQIWNSIYRLLHNTI